MKKTQIGWPFILILSIIFVFVIYQNSISATPAPFFILIILLLFNSLTIRVTDKYVKFSFGIGLINGKYKLEDIEYCKPINYSALGWGIRLKQSAILYNVSGTKAIELSIKGKYRKVWIGTDDPDEIAEYINSKRFKTSL